MTTPTTTPAPAPTAPKTLPRVGITHGDINGIGYEVILRTLAEGAVTDICTPVIYGSAKIAGQYRRLVELPPVPLTTIEDASRTKPGQCSIINVVDDTVQATPGQPSQQAGQAALAALERAVKDLREGRIDILVTAPIDKSTIQSEQFHFPGHTEYLQQALAPAEGDAPRALMLMCSDRLRVALVTTHLPISEVAMSLTTEAVAEKIHDLDRALRRDFDLDGPRIAVLALNPHAGDHGLLGQEEETVIAPAIAKAAQEGVSVFGPYSPDGFWSARMYDRFDGVLAMYHDQGLAPFKALAGDTGVNYTAGLGWVRTSPDHGTAYDIAGKGVADAASMRHAVWQAVDIYHARRRHADATANPLKKQYHDRGRDNYVLDLTKD